LLSPNRPRLAVLISGRGRNLQALIQAVRDGRIPAELALVASNRAAAPGLTLAHSAGIPTAVLEHNAFASREAFDAALAQTLRGCGVDFLLLAGFMRVLGAGFVEEFAGRMLNIHPSLLPKYAGLDTHRRALAAGETEHGATVHFVSGALDGGPRVIQGAVRVQPGEDPATLAERVLERLELRIFPQAAAWIARGELKLVDGVPHLRGRRVERPLTMDHLEEGF
jgi:phosphoribosylglycinamide formyltransferase-1